MPQAVSGDAKVRKSADRPGGSGGYWDARGGVFLASFCFRRIAAAEKMMEVYDVRAYDEP